MPDPTDQRQRRANRVGMRTLRQRPKLAGALPDGEPVYEIRSVRLVLCGRTPHFNRLVACERCGQDQAGAPVLSIADLDAPLRPIICADCVRRAGVLSVWEVETTKAPSGRPPPRGPVAPPVEAVRAHPEPPPAAPADDSRRLAVMEDRLRAVATRVEDLSRVARAQQAAEAERQRERAALAAIRSELADAVAEARAATRAAAAAPPRDEARLDAMERRFQAMVAQVEELSRLTQAHEAAAPAEREREEAALAAVKAEMAGAVADVRAEIASVTRQNTMRMAAFEAQLRQDLGTLSRLADTQRGDLTAIVAEIHQVRSEVQRVVATSQELAEAQTGMERSASDAAARAASSYTEGLSTIQAVVEQRMHELATQMAQVTARVDALVYSTEDITSRLEDRLVRLAGNLAVRTPDADDDATSLNVQPAGEDGFELLDALDLQLRKASDRLSSLSASRRREDS